MSETWQDIVQREIVQDIRKARNNKLEKVWQGKLLASYNHYIKQKRKGDYSYKVDEWDKFELERDRERMRELEKQNIKGEVKIMEKKISIELTKDYNKVIIGVDNILEVDDFSTQKDWAWNEAVELISRIPDGGFGTVDKSKNVSKQQYTKQQYPPKPHQPKPAQSYVTVNDIQCGVNLSPGQKGVAVKRINKGEITLEAVNAIKTFDEAQRVIFGK